jgi:hypothetical protein
MSYLSPIYMPFKSVLTGFLLNTFIHSNYVQISFLSTIYMPFKSAFERNPLCILHKRHRLENWESSNYTNNWGLFGKDNYLPFDWWKHFLKILRRSEDTINLTRRLKKIGSRWVRPLVVLYSIFYYYCMLWYLSTLNKTLFIYYLVFVVSLIYSWHPTPTHVI